MRNTVFGFVALLAFVVLGASHTMAQDCSSVPNQSFAIAAASGPAAGFSGVWEGTWTIQTGMRKNSTAVSYCTHLHVSVTGPDSANVMYCLGSQPTARIAAGCVQYPAKISGDQLTFTSRANIAYTFTQSGGSLTGTYASPVRSTEQPTTTFHKL